MTASSLAFLGRNPAIGVLILVLAWVTFAQPYRNGPPIRSDGVGYHVWTYALLDRDLRFCSLLDRVHTAGLAEAHVFSRIDRARGMCLNRYPYGLALLRLPLMAPFAWSRTASDAKRPLISGWEHRISLLSGSLALVGLCLLLRSVMEAIGVRPPIAQLSIAAVVFGTGLFHYASYDSSFTHAYSAFFVVLMIWAFAAPLAQGTGRTRSWAAAIAGFFIVALRNVNIFLIACFALGLIFGRWPKRPRVSASLYSLAAGALLAGVLQLAYNTYASGGPAVSSYGSEHFLWSRPMIGSVLVSYERGVITYYPVLALAVLTGLAVRPTRRAAAHFLVTGLALAGVYGFWHSWYLGGGFGHRGFVELAPAATLLIAGSLSHLPRSAGIVATALCALCVYVTMQTMWGYWQGTFPFEHATSHLYWSHVLGRHGFPTALYAALAAVAALSAWSMSGTPRSAQNSRP